MHKIAINSLYRYFTYDDVNQIHVTFMSISLATSRAPLVSCDNFSYHTTPLRKYTILGQSARFKEKIENSDNYKQLCI